MMRLFASIVMSVLLSFGAAPAISDHKDSHHPAEGVGPDGKAPGQIQKKSGGHVPAKEQAPGQTKKDDDGPKPCPILTPC
jgi:hypothetical protein